MAELVTTLCDFIRCRFQPNDDFLRDRAYCSRILINEMNRNNDNGGTTFQCLTTFIEGKQDSRLKHWSTIAWYLIVMSRIAKVKNRMFTRIPNDTVLFVSDMEKEAMLERIAQAYNDGVSTDGILAYLERRFGDIDEAKVAKKGGPSSLDTTHKVFYFTDGSSTEEGVGASICVYSNNQVLHQHSLKLNNYNTVFQAEITALLEAVKHAIAHFENEKVTFFIDNKASVLAISNPKSTSPTARQISNYLLDHKNFKVSWIKAHANYPGNEKADELAKLATTTGAPYPISYIKSFLRLKVKQDWQILWNKSTKGKKIHDLLPLVSLHPTSWSRELCIFLSEHGPFPEYLYRFGLSSTPLSGANVFLRFSCSVQKQIARIYMHIFLNNHG
ncbi:hypothetical protein AVEN_62885-1 [Araneus ventricosus]|uniref:ribonuclease H n=1 Tax=Araneus ventricosus TaxID=182803 RepID=A0A4Y2QWI7_ARAVE|nr:hypothetical protein AVEN_62885-1 [Araneus ventricosus]